MFVIFLEGSEIHKTITDSFTSKFYDTGSQSMEKASAFLSSRHAVRSKSKYGKKDQKTNKILKEYSESIEENSESSTYCHY
jgi:hypothetical protein